MGKTVRNQLGRIAFVVAAAAAVAGLSGIADTAVVADPQGDMHWSVTADGTCPADMHWSVELGICVAITDDMHW